MPIFRLIICYMKETFYHNVKQSLKNLLAAAKSPFFLASLFIGQTLVLSTWPNLDIILANILSHLNFNCSHLQPLKNANMYTAILSFLVSWSVGPLNIECIYTFCLIRNSIHLCACFFNAKHTTNTIKHDWSHSCSFRSIF